MQPCPLVAPWHSHSACPTTWGSAWHFAVRLGTAPVPFREQLPPWGRESGRWHRASVVHVPGQPGAHRAGAAGVPLRVPPPGSCLISQARAGGGWKLSRGCRGRGWGGRTLPARTGGQRGLATAPGVPELRHAAHRALLAGGFASGIPPQFPPEFAPQFPPRFPRALQEAAGVPKHPPAAALHRGAHPLVRGARRWVPAEGTLRGGPGEGQRLAVGTWEEAAGLCSWDGVSADPSQCCGTSLGLCAHEDLAEEWGTSGVSGAARG